VSVELKPSPATTGHGDHDRFAHYIYDPTDPKARITEAIVMGTPLLALCGKMWVPSRDASTLPVCPECADIKTQLVG